MKKILTLCIIHQHPNILLGMKKRGLGTGKWNGFGGKVEEDETIEDAARREVMEEAGIEVGLVKHMGILDFTFQNDNPDMEVHVFKAKSVVGNPAESDEMKPQWFHIDDIPYETMWADDAHWLPLLLEDKKFRGTFHFANESEIVDYELEELEVEEA